MCTKLFSHHLKSEIRVRGKVFSVHVKKGELKVWLHSFLTSALVGGEISASHPCRFNPGVGNRVILDAS
jgi:hypothetical protein